jgi:hypothetical protein
MRIPFGPFKPSLNSEGVSSDSDVNHYVIIKRYLENVPITVTARYKAWTLFAPSKAGIVHSKPTQGTNVCVRLFCV